MAQPAHKMGWEKLDNLDSRADSLWVLPVLTQMILLADISIRYR
jgi:hypothetical protein